ncbi:putative Ig mu chain C region membrane-bound form protein, partial [Naja naja]
MSHSSCDSRDGVIQLWCQITDFYPKQLDIEWKVGSRSGLLHPYNYPPWQNPGTYTFSTTSIVNVTQASQTKVKGKLKKCEGGSSCPSGNVNVYLVPPIPRALYIDRNSKISCFVNNLQNEQGLKITWSREKNGHLNVDLLETVEEPNGTYTVVSRLNVIAQDWESGESFTCTVEHPSFVSPVIKNIFKTRVVIMENDYSLEKEEELEHLWTILFIFFILFLFSMCYSAIVTLFK